MQQNMAGVSEIANTADVVARKAEELRSGTDRFRT
jgi:methyl-accepting chemotaxis protein